jgi:hypothetical protein
VAILLLLALVLAPLAPDLAPLAPSDLLLHKSGCVWSSSSSLLSTSSLRVFLMSIVRICDLQGWVLGPIYSVLRLCCC